MMTADTAKQLLKELFQSQSESSFAVRLWDDSTIEFGTSPTFTLVFRSADVFASLMRAPTVSHFADAYIANQFDIEGDIEAALKLSSAFRGMKLPLWKKIQTAWKLGLPKTSHSREEDMRDVQAHYDHSNDFYKLFLDERMVYSCAYFTSPNDTLEQAQMNKLDHICKKLRLQKDELLLDVGCGWGALVIWAVQKYGVRAHGITLSKQQFDLATERVKDAGLSDRITIEMRHYLDLPEASFDKISSVGMYEHVGIAKYPEYFRALHRALKPGGLLLNHGITTSAIPHADIGGDFIQKYIFPGSELDTIWHTTKETELAGFEVLDIEELRLHYARTLREWNTRYRAARDQAKAFVKEHILRAWDLYLPGCAKSFDENMIGLYQTLAAKNFSNGTSVAPLTREDIYRV